MNFVENKYYTWYKRLISNSQQRFNLDGYSEKHHIIPNSLGGTNDASNLVILTAREHYIAHLLLTKITVGNDYYKMSHAAWRMGNHTKHKISSRSYERVRKLHSEALSSRVITDATRKKMGAASKARKKSDKFLKNVGKSGQENHFYGKQHTETTKKTLADINTGKTHSLETKTKMATNWHEKRGLVKPS